MKRRRSRWARTGCVVGGWSVCVSAAVDRGFGGGKPVLPSDEGVWLGGRAIAGLLPAEVVGGVAFVGAGVCGKAKSRANQSVSVLICGGGKE